jgi:mRNA interferase RelE/StbE
MNTIFKKTFLKDLKQAKNKKLQNAIAKCIDEIESVENLLEIKHLKKLKGYEYYYRIRIGDYRIGLKIEDETVYFVVFDHRKDIYTKFP